jgi:4'-phosphopantetheinyl transferase
MRVDFARVSGVIAMGMRVAEPWRAHAGAWQLLTAREQGRAREFRFARDRSAFIAAHALARLCVSELTIEPVAGIEIAQHCRRCGADDHGRPGVVSRPHVHVSLSHTSGYSVAAAAYVSVGVDVEHVPSAERAIASAGERDGHLAPRTAVSDWVRHEALLKLGAAPHLVSGGPVSSAHELHEWRIQPDWVGALALGGRAETSGTSATLRFEQRELPIRRTVPRCPATRLDPSRRQSPLRRAQRGLP